MPPRKCHASGGSWLSVGSTFFAAVCSEVVDETASWFFFPPSTGLLVSFMNENACAGAGMGQTIR